MEIWWKDLYRYCNQIRMDLFMSRLCAPQCQVQARYAVELYRQQNWIRCQWIIHPNNTFYRQEILEIFLFHLIL